MLRDDRPVLGRQRGLADHRRRRHLRRVPGLVRDDVLRLLHRAPAPARAADRPRSISFEWRGKAESPRWRAVWTWVNTIASVGIPLIWGIALSSLLHGVADLVASRSSPARSGISSRRTRSLAGVAFVLLFALHGAVFLDAAHDRRPPRARRADGGPHRRPGGARRRRVPRLDARRRDRQERPGRLPRHRRRRARRGRGDRRGRARPPAGARGWRSLPPPRRSCSPSSLLFTELYPRVMVSSTELRRQPHDRRTPRPATTRSR